MIKSTKIILITEGAGYIGQNLISFFLKEKYNIYVIDNLSTSQPINKYKININENTLNTKDGTPERDFIHIHDLCRIHKEIFFYLDKNKKVIFNCVSGIRYSVLQIVRGFAKSINKKFKIFYKKNNPDEIQTICSHINQLKKLLKIDIKKNKINDFVRDYL